MSSFQALTLCKGQQIKLHDVLTHLLSQGYQRVGKVHDPGDCALRGGLLDVFPEGFEAPVRIELDAEVIVGIRSVHPVTGEPFLSHEMVILLPAVPLRRRPLKTKLHSFFLDEGSPLDPFVDIQAEDLVVHVTHGIGRYLGLKKLRVKDHLAEHLVLEYAHEDRLYVPLSEINLLQKYIGFEGKPPALSRLGTRYWQRAKEWARKGAASVAKELLALEAQRLTTSGFAFSPDGDWQKQLESSFPYRQTAGQIRAMEEIKKDMESPRPMDRLLVGDVGYGKTEVALRAAFKACLDNRQVALLCPTTILAEQHEATFSGRMKAFPVSIARLSRFQTKAEQSRIVKELPRGSIDVVIGTHRLLSPDVRFKNLGLIIIDEEQRFGVRHKEQFKRYRAQVDVLSLTATPIPRTLYLALMGARSLSTIETPPFDRLPVTTLVGQENDALIAQAIRRELDRRGQVFVVTPWIEGIGKLRNRIARLVPQARIAVAHGQMPSRPLEKAMLSFMHKEIDVLISTAIVESGIDIPNANTLLVFRADTFGLADLYQLRGRVGRFNRQAFAHFLTPKGMPLSHDSQKRLGALREFSGLGAGFQLALRDLQLRGAGNLLGVEQHGHIVAVGFDLYCRLLKVEIERLKRS